MGITIRGNGLKANTPGRMGKAKFLSPEIKRKARRDHNCIENAVTYESDGALGHGWECGICGTFLQAG